ncbi:hypothetical protein D6V68_11730 [Escherichia albertii]|nr:hypothetical protein [Escherichia albertii]EFO0109018.1 hypothetical protein [Escherichia albertii]EGE0302424.1 hypothetical protein [Escherichia albertii]MLY50277.1 hypothetical protein [Escherichia albertii]
MPDATLARLIRPTMGSGSVGWIRRLRRIRRLCSGVWCQGGLHSDCGQEHTDFAPNCSPLSSHCHLSDRN